jgi:SAM-dependent methyltransferase
MHRSSFEHMKALVDEYLDVARCYDVCDIGSQDVNGSYRILFDHPGWRYLGVDVAAGKNVDVVLTSPYRLPMSRNSFDVVISGQAFEHIDFFWLTWLEMVRVLKHGGWVFLIVPSRGPEHRYPVDCWRFYPDALDALARLGAMQLVKASTDWEPDADPDSAAWGDTVGVFRKPATGSPAARLTTYLRRISRRR